MGAGALAVVLVFGVALNSSDVSQPGPQRVRAAPGKLPSAVERSVAVTLGNQPRVHHEPLVSDGVIQTVLDAAVDAHLASAPRIQSRGPSSVGGGAGVHTFGCQNVFSGSPKNIKVNQDCSFRRKAEEQIVIDPTNPNHLLAGQNDARIGFNHCGIDVSFDRGKTWGDMVPPLWGYLLKDNRTADAGSDPALAFDSQGNAYFTCILFNVVADSVAIVVAKSNAQFGGTFFHAPAPGPFQAFSVTTGASPPGSNGVVVSEPGNTVFFHDKEFLFADTSNSSPRRDRAYVTWTRFREENACQHGTSRYCESPIFFSQSVDGGDHWSAPIEISGTNAEICSDADLYDTTLDPTKCNFDQGSWMVIAPNGALYVFFNNENVDENAQQLMVTCPSDGRNCALAASWTDPVQVALDVNTQPMGPAFGCATGRQCLPPNTYRINDFGAAGTDPNTGRLYFAWADYQTGQNHVYLVHSYDGGNTWSEPEAVTGTSTAATKSAQWQPWMAVGPQGFVYVAYYDRQYGNCEQTGCNDITLAVSHDHGQTFEHKRITTFSMPNLTLATNPIQAGFLGDYMSVVADGQGVMMVWADTRPRAGTTPAEEVYFATLGP
jgi:hypothetical protein